MGSNLDAKLKLGSIAILSIIGVVYAKSNLGPPVLAPINMANDYPEGANVHIMCTIVSGDRQNLEYEWKKNDIRIPSSGKQVATTKRHLEIETHPENELSRLTVTNLTSSDAGEYRCTARNNFGQSSLSAKLVVTVEMRWLEEPNDIDIGTGQRLAIPCSASGQPEPEIRWRKTPTNRNSSKFEVDRGQLIIGAVSLEDSGIYECVASNGGDEILRKVIKVTVQDSLRILCKAGAGGHGLPQFGGIGGKGGDIYIKGSKINDMKLVLSKNPTKRYIAKNGSNATKHHLVGDPGPDLIIDCPIGVTVEDEDKQVLGDIDQLDQKVLVAVGGRGGDKYCNNLGSPGQRRMIRLDLKMIADIGLVGFPNAGKSTMLKTLSQAKPKIASFPFTTLSPNIGIIKYDDLRSISLTDLPGLVEDAHKNVGLGHRFLKHATRTKLIAFVIDINGVDIGPKYPTRSALESLFILQRELQLYDEYLYLKPAVLVLSQLDKEGSEQKLNQFMEDYNNIIEKGSKLPDMLGELKPMNIDSILPVSCHSLLNIDKLKIMFRDTIDKYAEIEKFKQDGIENYEKMIPMEFNRMANSD